MFSACVRFGILPNLFSTGLLIPILKKSTLDTSVAKNYRPITVLVVISKLMENYILEECESHIPSTSQFGFIKHRGTNLATDLAHDTGAICNAMGPKVYYCSLDA